MTTLSNQVILVTGGGRGLGEAICRNIAHAGAVVVVADLKAELADSVAASLLTQGYQALPVRLDVSKEESAAVAVNEVMSRYGRIDGLINNAGVDLTVSIEEMTIADWDRIVSTNLRGPFLLSKNVFPHMKSQGRGTIVNVVSTAAKRAWCNASAYHASKWGLLGLSHALHVEARPYQIKVTALVCGGMRTPFLLERFPDIDTDTLQRPEDVAETVRFLLSTPAGTVIPEMMAIPLKETSWP